MPEFFQQTASAPLPTENLFNNLKTAKNFFSNENQFYKSIEMKNLFALFKEKNIHETQLDQLDKMKKMTVALIVNNQNVCDIPSLELRLTTKLKNNEQQIHTQIKKMLSNNQCKFELRKLAARQVQLLEAQRQLIEACSEEIINDKQAQKFKSLINAEFDRFYSGPVRELYQQDFQAILEVGMTESDLSYLRDLSQLDNAIHPIIEKEIDNYQNEKQNDRANYLIEAAEQLIAEATSGKASNQSFINSTVAHFVSQELGEDDSLPPLYTVNSANAVYELLLNGADPVKESQGLASTPLAHHFAARYVLEQDLNRVHISIISLNTQLNPKFAKQVLLEQFLEEKKQLETSLKNNLKTITAEIKRQPELKINLENQLKELNKEAKQLKLELTINKKSKKKIKALTPESQIELSHQLERLKREKAGLRLALKNNTALIDAHIKAIILRDADAQVSDFPDIERKERFQQTWDNCKQEIKRLPHTQLTENFSAYDFLTQDLYQLTTIGVKTLKRTTKHFSEYKPLLHSQNDQLNNYWSVQGPPVAPTTELRPVVNTSNNSIKAPDIFEINTREKQGTPLNVKISTEKSQLIASFNRTRLNNSGFFNASVQSESPSKSPLVPEKTSERTPRLNRSLLFFTQGNSGSKLVNKDSQVKTCMVSSFIRV